MVTNSNGDDQPPKQQPVNNPDEQTEDEHMTNHNQPTDTQEQEDPQAGIETLPVRPADMAERAERKKLRPGEISLEGLTEQTSTRKLDDTDFEDGDPRWGTARFNRRMLLEIKLRDSSTPDGRFTFDYDAVEEIVIGRRDPKTDAKPDIDLEPFGGLNKGVSRQHASIVRRDGALNLVDNGSPNGTFLNGQKLVAQQPRILRDGDDIRLGHLVVRVSFRRARS